jgi:flagellar motor switch protein FliN
VSTQAAVEHVSRMVAEACADVLTRLSGSPATTSEVVVGGDASEAMSGLDYPLASVDVAFVGEIEGANSFLLRRADAGALAQAMMHGVGEFDGNDEMTLSAVSEAMNQMMGGAAVALASEFAIDIDIAPPTAAFVESAADLGDMPDDALVARFRLSGEGFAADVVQIVPAPFAAVLEKALAAAATMRASTESAEPKSPADEATLHAVERAARITAQSAASVLSVLVGDRADATMPEIEVQPEDPMARLSFPAIAVEVAFVSGVTGSNLFVLTPQQAATLAALMMGMDEATGDGLSDIELSAVSEAMNQMMGAATNEMADMLSMDIEVSPPVVTILQTHEDAVRVAADCAYVARFRLMSDRFTADVVQVVTAGFAEHLGTAFAAADTGRDLFADSFAASAASPMPDPGAIDGLAEPTANDAAMLLDVRVRVSAELGRTRLPVSRAGALPAGAVVVLDRAPSDPIDVLVNGKAFAFGRLVLVDGEYAVQITELIHRHGVAA